MGIFFPNARARVPSPKIARGGGKSSLNSRPPHKFNGGMKKLLFNLFKYVVYVGGKTPRGLYPSMTLK